MKYFYEYAIMIDELQYFVFYFSEFHIRKMLAKHSDEIEQDLSFYYQVRAISSKTLPVYLEPFFYYDGNRASFFSLYIATYLYASETNLDNIILRIYDSEKLKNYMIEYYFAESTEIPTQEHINSGRLPQFVRKLNISDSLKIYLTYCLEHLSEVQESLVYLLHYFYPIIEKLHKDNQAFVDEMETQLSQPETLKLLGEYSIGQPMEIGTFIWAASLLQPHLILVKDMPSVFVLGKRFLENINQGMEFENVTIETYNEAVHVYTRRKIIELLRINTQMSVKELAEELYMSVPAVFLHIDTLINERIIVIHAKRRQAFLYSLNVDYFKNLAALYNDYYIKLKNCYKEKQQSEENEKNSTE